jgi:hypothetical protein
MSETARKQGSGIRLREDDPMSKKVRNHSDPVLPDQSGRLMAVDPKGTNAPRDEVVRRRAYEIYERRGREDGQAWQDWFRAEGELNDDNQDHQR